MSKLSDDERNLLRYYAETDRIIHGPVRGAVHQHLLRMGYIKERAITRRGSPRRTARARRSRYSPLQDRAQRLVPQP